MKDIQQLIKKNSQEGRYEDIFPKTFIDAVEDRESGNNLTEILSGFNMYFLSYNGSREYTRLQVPLSLRKTGLWITYVLYDKTVVTEWYAGEAIDDDSWKSPDNWRGGTNMLVGDISISSDGYWVVNGVITTAKAQGEQGITPMLRVGSNNYLQASYTNGSSWADVSTNPVYTQFRINNNKLEQSVDLGQTWTVVSDSIASWFRFTGTTGSSQNVGKIQISRDNGVTWSDLSGEFTNSLYIKGYVATVGALPSSAVQGDIYGVGPTYDPSDTEQNNPIYQLYVKDSTGWVNNGKFTSIAAGVVQTTGTSTTEVMSQDAVSKKFAQVETDLNVINDKLYGTRVELVEIIITTSAESSYKDYIFNEPIPVGSTLISMTTSVRGWLIRSDGSYNTDTSFYTYPKVTEEVYIGVGVRDASTFKIKYEKGEFTDGLVERVDIIETDIFGSGGLEKRLLDIETEVNGDKVEQITEEFNSTNIGWGDLIFTSIIPSGSVITSRSVANSSYLLKLDGNVDVSARLDTMILPFVTTQEYKGISANGSGIFKLTYVNGYDTIGLNDVATFKGKTIVCFGDSLTENRGDDGRRYSDIIESMSGAHVINVGVGGSRLQQRRVPSADLSSILTDYERYQTALSMFDVVNMIRAACNKSNENGVAYTTMMDSATEYLLNPQDSNSGASIDLSSIKAALYAIDWPSVDAVTIFAGTNDWRNASEYLGESGSLNASRTLGSINTIISDLLSTYKHIKLFWFSPTIRWIDYVNGVGEEAKFSDVYLIENRTLRDYSAIIETEVKRNHIPFCDMYNTLGWNLFNFGDYFYKDGTHPTKGKGFEVIAKKIFGFLMANRTF